MPVSSARDRSNALGPRAGHRRHGFLGRAVAEALGARGPRCACAARAQCGRRSRARLGRLRRRRRRSLPGTARSTVSTTVVHLAGLAHLPDATAAAAAETFARVNAEGTARLASAAAVGAGVRRFVLMSSALVHGQASPGRPFTEDDAPAPASPYARSKLDSERRLHGGRDGVSAAMGDPAPADGLRRRARGATSAGWSQLVRAGVPLPLGAATAPRSFIGIDNLADAVVRAVEHPRAANQVFLVADAETTSTVDLVHLHRRRRSVGAFWTPHVPAALLRDRARAWLGARATVSACSIRSSSTPAASARCSTGRRRCRWTRACAAPCRASSAELTRRPDRWARGSRWPAGWSRSPCRRRPSARRTSPPSCRPCARRRCGWRCSSRSRC